MSNKNIQMFDNSNLKKPLDFEDYEAQRRKKEKDEAINEKLRIELKRRMKIDNNIA